LGSDVRARVAHPAALLRGACLTLSAMSAEAAPAIRVSIRIDDVHASEAAVQLLAHRMAEEHGLQCTTQRRGTLVTVTFRRPDAGAPDRIGVAQAADGDGATARPRLSRLMRTLLRLCPRPLAGRMSSRRGP
jgi:hypothetical protein